MPLVKINCAMNAVEKTALWVDLWEDLCNKLFKEVEWKKKHKMQTSTDLQCLGRQQLLNLVRIQPQEGGEENSGLLYHRHDLGTGPWRLYGLDKNLLTCLAPQLTHLHIHRYTERTHIQKQV